MGEQLLKLEIDLVWSASPHWLAKNWSSWGENDSVRLGELSHFCRATESPMRALFSSPWSFSGDSKILGRCITLGEQSFMLAIRGRVRRCDLTSHFGRPTGVWNIWRKGRASAQMETLPVILASSSGLANLICTLLSLSCPFWRYGSHRVTHRSVGDVSTTSPIVTGWKELKGPLLIEILNSSNFAPSSTIHYSPPLFSLF